MNANFYYIKYLKYKNKYIKFKEQIGGMGTEKCPDKYSNQSVSDLLRVYNCTYNQIPKKILESFDYEALKVVNSEEGKHQITIKDLKSRNFPVKFFVGKNFPINELIEAGYLVFKLIEDCFTYRDMKEADISLETLNKSGLDLSPKNAEETYKMLKEAGYTINDFFDVYAKLSKEKKVLIIIKMAGFTLEEIIGLNKFTKEQLKKEFTAEEVEEKFKDKEYTLEEILAAIKDESGNFDSIKLKKINENRKIDLNLIKSHIPFSILFDSKYSKEDLLDSGFLPNEFIYLYKERKELSPFYNLTRLKELFTLQKLLTAKISLEDILQIGYEPCELKELGISAESFKEIIHKKESLFQKLKCYTLKELKDAGYDETKILLNFNYSLEELQNNGYTLKILKIILPKEYFEKHILQKFTLDEIIENYNGDELINILINIWNIKNKFIENKKNIASKLKEKGFTSTKLYFDIRFKINEILKFGFDINELKDLPNVVIELRKECYNLEYFKSNDFSVLLLKSGRYTANELKDAGYSVNELKDDFHIIELKDAGYNISEMIGAEFSPLDLYLLGFSKEEIIKYNGANTDLELFSNLLEHAKNPEIYDDSRILIIKQILGIRDDFFILYCLRENKVPLHLIIAALGNLENIFDYLKYVFIPDDFVNDKKIELGYYAAEFPINDLLILEIFENDLLRALNVNITADILHRILSEYNSDKELEVKVDILKNINLKELLKKYTIDEVQKTLKYYFKDKLFMTPYHPWYKSFKKINDEIYKTENGLL